MKLSILCLPLLFPTVVVGELRGLQSHPHEKPRKLVELPCDDFVCFEGPGGESLIYLAKGVACPEFATILSGNGICVSSPADIENESARFKLEISKGGPEEFVAVTRVKNASCKVDGDIAFDTVKEFSVQKRPQVTRTTENKDGTLTVTSTGAGFIIMFPGDTSDVPGKIPAGPSYTLYAGGKVTYTVFPDEDNKFDILEASGKFTDVCAELNK